MKKVKSEELINQLQADVRQLITDANFLRGEDPGVLMQQPAPGKWNVLQVIEHLNSYDRYYLLAIERSLKSGHRAVEYFTPGWLGDYFTKLMKPGEDGRIAHKMQAPKDHRPPAHLDVFPVMTAFLEQQQYLLELLEQARVKNIGTIRTPVSISRLVRLKLGDTFRFLIAHKQRHFVQIKNTLAAVKGISGKYSSMSPAI